MALMERGVQAPVRMVLRAKTETMGETVLMDYQELQEQTVSLGLLEKLAQLGPSDQKVNPAILDLEGNLGSARMEKLVQMERMDCQENWAKLDLQGAAE